MKRLRIFSIALVSFMVFTDLYSQSPVLAFTASYASATSSLNTYSTTPASGSNSFSSCGATSYTYTFNSGSSNVLKLTSITTASKNFFISNSTPAVVKLRRVNNASVSGNRSIISLEAASATAVNCAPNAQIALRSPYQDNMESFINTNIINQGTDNIFTNTGNGDGNNNNIERVDVIFPSGISSLSAIDAGFTIFDRGPNYGHDPFRIAAITRLDDSGDPAAFGIVKTCQAGNGSTSNGSWGHPSTANGNKTFAVYVLRKEGSEGQLKVSAAVNQEIGAVFFSFADLGIADNQTIYGYTLLAADGIAGPSSAQLLNLNDASVYPTNTSQTNGGLDLIAVNAIFSTGGAPLSVAPLHLEGSISNGKSLLHWQADTLLSGRLLWMERSKKGDKFSKLFSIVLGPGHTSGIYSESIEPNTYAYRLMVPLSTGQTMYSNVVQLKKPTEPVIQVYPTLVSSHQPIQVQGLKDGSYKAVFTSVEGQVYQAQFSVQNSMGRVELPTGPLHGFYYLTFFDPHQTFLWGSKILVGFTP